MSVEEFAKIGMWRGAGFPVILALAWRAWYGTLFLIALVGSLISILLDSRRKDLARLARELGLEFSPRVSPQRIGTQGTTFDVCIPAENCLRGMIGGRETVIFDLRMRERTVGGFSEAKVPGSDGTIVGFRVPADCYCRSRDILQP